TNLSVIAEDDSDRYPAHVKKLAGAAARRIAELEDAIETAYGILWRDAGGYSSTAAFDARKVLLKVLDKDGQKRGIDAAISRYGAPMEREVVAAPEARPWRRAMTDYTEKARNICRPSYSGASRVDDA